jgi:formylglycine-generating enzyme required for sulfatase activity
MARYRILLRCVGEAVVANGLKCLAGLVPFGDRLYEIACDAHKRYQNACQIQEAVAQVEAVAQASLDEVKAEAREVFAEIRAAASPEVSAQLAQPAVEKGLVGYLEHVPAAVRSSLRRPADPTGRSVPQGFSVKKPEDFLRLLPPRPPRFQAGDRAAVGNWQLEELLGVGGFGEVWKARHPHFRNLAPVALKFCLDESSVRYLRHEAGLIDQMMAHSRLPGVVELRNAFLEADPPCLEYEFINGGDLCGLLHQWQTMKPADRIKQATQLIQRLAGILAPLHRLNPAIVHRDLKPANILMVRKESGKYDVKIGDFGIGGVSARQALLGASRGVSRGDLLSQSLRGSHTPLYASPEQTRGSEPDPRDDVHALGVMWFQLLVGDLGRGTGVDLEEELRELEVSEDTIGLVKGCVTRANRRFDDAGVLVDRISSLTRAETPKSSPAVSPPPAVVPVPSQRDEGPVRTVDTPRSSPAVPSLPPVVLVPSRREERPVRTYDVVLDGFDVTRKISVIKAVREQLGVGLKQAKDLVDAVPRTIKHSLTREEAAQLQAQLETAGAKIVLRPVVPVPSRREEGPVQTRDRQAGETIAIDLGGRVSMTFAWIPPGTFLMGSPESEVERSNDEVQHRVTLTREYWLGIHPVTQAQWQAVMGANPSTFKGDDRCPAENVSWDDCQEFVKTLGQKTGKRFRLPTEAEWEYACRAGTTTPFFFGETFATDQANYDVYYTYGQGKKGVYRQKTTPVGSFPANAWGLYDMHGNVWEWCQDWYGPYSENDIKDPQGSDKGDARVLRGGSWYDFPARCRSAYRHRRGPGFRNGGWGCRVVLCLD